MCAAPCAVEQSADVGREGSFKIEGSFLNMLRSNHPTLTLRIAPMISFLHCICSPSRDHYHTNGVEWKFIDKEAYSDITGNTVWQARVHNINLRHSHTSSPLRPPVSCVLGMGVLDRGCSKIFLHCQCKALLVRPTSTLTVIPHATGS